MKKTAVWGLLILWICAPAMAKEKEPKEKSKPVAVAAEATPPSADGLFTDGELKKIKAYYHGAEQRAPEDSKTKKQKKLPPGLQKKVARGGELPPGWQKKVARGEVLDAAVYDRSESIPEDLRRQLPAQPPGTEVIQAGGKVIRVIRATREILDVLDP